MKLASLLETGAIAVPWPTRVGITTIKPMRPEPIYCSRECKTKSCHDGKGTRLGVQCHAGFTYYQATIDDEIVVCYGVLGSYGKDTLQKKIQHDHKEDLKGRGLGAADFQQWIEKLTRLKQVLNSEHEQITSRALEPLHETPKLAKEILNAATALVNKRSGRTWDERFDDAPPELRSIQKTAELLVDSFDMLSIFFNPASAEVGALVRCEPYKLVDKLSRIIGNQFARGVEGRVRIELRGNSFRAYEVYDSFKVIPMTILDNAVKYSFDNLVTVSVTDEAVGTRVAVRSIGPLIIEDERSRIFDRSERGIYAAKLHSQGMGVGLFVAACAARANGITIGLSSIPTGYQRSGIPVATNEFSFLVRDAPAAAAKR